MLVFRVLNEDIPLFLRPMTQRKPVRPSAGLANVRYEIRGKLARRALALGLVLPASQPAKEPH